MPSLPFNWRAYDAVVIRSTWDYIEDPDAFNQLMLDFGLSFFIPSSQSTKD